MAKEGKKPIFKRVWFWVLVVVILVAAVGGSQSPKVVDKSASGSEATESKGDDDAASQDSEKQSTENLAPGTTVDLGKGVTVTVDSVQTGLANYDGSTVVCAHVTYVNGSDESTDYNVYDWKGEDANGAQENSTYYSEATDELSAGTLAAGGTKSGNVYFKEGTVKIDFFGNVFSDKVQASWVVQ